MFLFQDIDANKTEENVIEFFKHDYNKLLNMANTSLIKSPIMSFTTDGRSNDNTQENKFTKISWAKSLLDVVHSSIGACSTENQIVIYDKFINRNENISVMMKLYINSNDKFYKIKKIAANQFADIFEVRAEPFFENGENDLHVYKN